MEISQNSGMTAFMGGISLLFGINAFITGVMIFIKDQNRFVLLVWIALLSVICMIAGCILIKKYQRPEKERKRLLNEGVRYDADIVALHHDKTFRLKNGQSPYIAECIYVNEQQEKIRVKSKYLWPRRKYIAGMQELEAEVYVDRINPAQYYILVRDKTKR